MQSLWKKSGKEKTMIKKIINYIKEAFTFPKSSEFIYECINCGEKFDGKTVEYFIKHQIDLKHFDARKYRKNQKDKT